MLMNSEFVLAQADHFAVRLVKESPDVKGQVIRGWQLACGASPSEAEVQSALTFLKEQGERFRAVPAKEDPQRRALASFCQALLSSNRFLYVD